MSSKRKLVRCPLCEKTAANKPERLAIREKRLKFLETRNQWHDKSDQMQLIIVKNWKNYNVLNKVMNQGSCGCCWAVGACRCTDSVYKLTNWTKKLIETSPQDLVNSITPPPLEMLNFEDEKDREREIKRREENRGFGYSLHGAYQHMKDEGVRFASQVPFVGIRTETRAPKRPERFLKIKNFVRIEDDEEALYDAVSSHPVAARLTMTKTSMQLFQAHRGTSKIFYGVRHPNGEKTSRHHFGDDDEITEKEKADTYSRHAILIVGYCMIGEVNCWIIMNSYGEKWGNNGFGYIP